MLSRRLFFAITSMILIMSKSRIEYSQSENVIHFQLLKKNADLHYVTIGPNSGRLLACFYYYFLECFYEGLD